MRAKVALPRITGMPVIPEADPVKLVAVIRPLIERLALAARVFPDGMVHPNATFTGLPLLL